MRPIWDVDGSIAANGPMAGNDSGVIDLDGPTRDRDQDRETETTATVLAARCHVALLDTANRGGATVDGQAAMLRRVLAQRSAGRGAAGRRRVERAVSAVRSGRTGRVSGSDLTALVEDLRVLEAALRGTVDSGEPELRP